MKSNGYHEYIQPFILFKMYLSLLAEKLIYDKDAM